MRRAQGAQPQPLRRAHHRLDDRARGARPARPPARSPRSSTTACKQGIPLGIDATLRYALNQWSRPLRVSELNSDSRFNTRQRDGLPPTPIGNPGLAALKAAANPANVSYLFYVVRPCGNGAHAFSSTDAKFQQDVAKYNAARAKRGGKDPSHCWPARAISVGGVGPWA